MTVNRAPNSPKINRLSLMAIAITVGFAIAAFFLTRPEPSLQSISPIAGLMSLKATAHDAVAYEVAMTNQKPTLVEFYADWCTTCQSLAPTLQWIHNQFGDRVNFVMLNIDEPQWREQIQQFRVTGVPHLVLLNDDQTVADTFIGKVPQQILADRVADLLG
jgi:thioredoxin-like negative regulator of GroEL